MKHFSTAIRESVQQHNWFSALFMALAMPDICGALETPDKKIGERYTRWFDENLASKYPPHLFPADECYFLRCAMLHQGITSDRKAKTHPWFMEPPPNGGSIHCNIFSVGVGPPTIQLQIDRFCNDVAQAVDDWALKVASKSDIQRRINELLVIHPPSALRGLM